MPRVRFATPSSVGRPYPLAAMSRHTPGPWILEAGRSFRTSSGTFHLSYGKYKNGLPCFPDFCELDANARLIVEAPAMLEALKLCARDIEACMGAVGMKNSATLDIARAIIARIEKEQAS